ncbi:MAG: hypothetical protein NTX49_00055, partial [Chlamydiae bacterium]|nr:hypothetical protein [Chlamydiota bacterium]
MNIFKKIGNWWSPPAAPAPPPEPIPSATHVSSLCEAIIRATARDPIVTAHAEELSKNWNVLKTQSSLTDDLRTKMEHAAAKLYSLGLQTLLPEITLDKLEKLYSSLETQLPTPTMNFTDLTLKVNYEIYEKIPHNIATDGRKPPIPEYLSKLENLNFESMYDKLEHNDPLPLTTIERTTFTNKIVLAWADIESHPPIDLEIAKKTLLIVYTLQHNQPSQPQLMRISDYISARLPIETHQDRIPTIICTAAAPVAATAHRATPPTASETRTIPPPPLPGFRAPIPTAASVRAPHPPPRPRDPPTGVGAGAGSTAIPGPATARLVSAEAPTPGSSRDSTTTPSEVGVMALALAEFAKATNPTYRVAKQALGHVMNLMRQENCLSLAGADSVGKMCRNLMKAISHLPEADQRRLFREEKDNITLILSFGMRGLILDARALLGKVAQYKGSMGLDDAKEYESYCFYVKFITQFYGNPPKSPLLESCNAILAYLKSIYLANRSRQPLIKPF